MLQGYLRCEMAADAHAKGTSLVRNAANIGVEHSQSARLCSSGWTFNALLDGKSHAWRIIREGSLDPETKTAPS